MVILPPFYYGAASYAVEAPEGTGSVHVDSQALHPSRANCSRIAARWLPQHPRLHSPPVGKLRSGMPRTSPSSSARGRPSSPSSRRRAARLVGDNRMADYYAQQAAETIRSTGSRSIR